MESVLVLSLHSPATHPHGSSARVTRVLEWMRSQGMAVHHLHAVRRTSRGLVDGPKESPHSLYASRQTIALLGCEPPCPRPIAFSAVARPHSFLPLRLWSRWRNVTEQMRSELAAVIRRTAATVLWCDHTEAAPLLTLAPASPGLLRVVDTHDVMHERDASLRKAGLPPVCGVTEAEERELLLPFDLIIAIQRQEQATLERLLPERRILTAGHCQTVDPQPCQSSDLCFLGSRYVINELGLLHFLQNSWPVIRARSPQTRLQICGGVAECPRIVQAAQRDPRLVLRGIAADVREFYAGPAVVICPLTIGSGLKIKLVEALAHGKAVVASPIAAQGLEEAAGHAFQLARDADDFTRRVLRLLESPAERQQQEQRAAEFARGQFSPAAVWGELNQYFAARRIYPPRVAYQANPPVLAAA